MLDRAGAIERELPIVISKPGQKRIIGESDQDRNRQSENLNTEIITTVMRLTHRARMRTIK